MSQGESAPVRVSSNLLEDFKRRSIELSSDDKKYDNKSFIDYVNDPNIAKIIDTYKYPDDGDTSTVVDKEGLINAFFANDLYKLSMGPVVHEVSIDQGGCIVQFRIDLRTDSTFNEKLKTEYVLKQGSNFVGDLTKQLDTLKARTFDAKMLENLTTGEVPMWKTYWKSEKAYPIQGKTLIETDVNEIIANYQKEDGSLITDSDFHRDSIILKCIPVPKDPKLQSTVVLSIVPGANDGDKPDIRATGYWPLCSWLETPLMQTTYEVMHRHFLRENGKTYGAWMAEALYRTFSGMEFLLRTEKPIKVALFSGRRTGGALFNLLQIYLWNQFDSQFYPPTHSTPNPEGRNLGTSSFWALETLKKLKMECSIQPSGTHAHELSMTLNVLYPELDVTDVGFVGSQILGHLLYKRLSAGPTPTPMLTDTVGTRNFLVTALALKDKDNRNYPALCSFASARQDSGDLKDYEKMMTFFVNAAGCKPPMLMASEIDDRDTDFYKAIVAGYSLAGVGGALGDSEKIEAIKILGEKFVKSNPAHFAASEAAKIARVWSGKNPSGGYTLKTGDGTGKVTIDDKAEESEKKRLGELASNFQRLHQAALKELNETENIELHQLEDLDNKQKILDEALRRIIAREGGHTVAAAPPPPALAAFSAAPPPPIRLAGTSSVILTQGDIVSTDQGEIGYFGGRRTRRKVRKVTKKNVRKNIRKSKHIRNRRSNRRNSRK
jgi:nicotinic acid phosphoribosyltransferase